MCLILFAYRCHPQYRLVMAANRDEFYERPTQDLRFWSDHPEIAAGRDLKQLGTWQGITRQGRFAAITNYREVGCHANQAPSRGHLVTAYLAGDMSPISYSKKLRQEGHRYNGFNLIFGDNDGIYYYSNRIGSDPAPLEPGIYGLSNRLLDSDWPKVRLGKSRLEFILQRHDNEGDWQALWNLLKDQSTVSDRLLPDTGVGPEWERILAPIFITSPTYGTRSSSILIIENSGEIEFSEITWHPARPRPSVRDQKRIRFSIPLDTKKQQCPANRKQRGN